MKSDIKELERKYGMKSYGIHRTRKGANRSKRGHVAFLGGQYTVKKVPFRHFRQGYGFMTFRKK